MKKILLGHCYTTENKGDAAIVIATIDSIRSSAPNARIQCMSTFSSRDDAFLHHHQDFIDAGAEMVPALMPEDKLFISGRAFKSPAAKALSFAKNLIACFLAVVLRAMRLDIIRGDVSRALRALGEADLFISKGGSFICNEGGFRGDLSLFKILLPFMIAKRSGARTIILAQSLGPFNTPVSRWLAGHFLKYVDKIYLREWHCLKYLEQVKRNSYEGKLEFCPDVAFALESSGFDPIIDVRPGTTNIGLTIVNYSFADAARKENYLQILENCVAYFQSKFADVRFLIFPQVLSPQVDGKVDLQLSRLFVARCATKLGVEVELVEGDFDCRALRETYGRMRFFIATRLHSSIFSASVGVPTLVFGYHGTKAEGVWHELGYDQFFFGIDDVSWQSVRAALDEVTDDWTGISSGLRQKTMQWRQMVRDIVAKELALGR